MPKDPMNTTFTGELHPHQHDGLAFLLREPRAVLADEVGLGKTVQLCALLGALYDGGQLRRPGRLPVLWVTTAGLVSQTAEELARFVPDLAVATVYDPSHKASASPRAVQDFHAVHPNGPDVFVVTYESAVARLANLLTTPPVVLVMDEASKVKGQGRLYDAMLALSAVADRSVAVTATAYENHPEEFWAVLSVAGIPNLCPIAFFGDAYCKYRKQPDGNFKCVGWRSQEAAREFMGWLGGRYLRRTAASVGLPLPTKEYTPPVLVPLNAAQHAEYRRAERIANRLWRFKRRAAIARRARDGSSDLVPAAVAHVSQLVETGEKVVVYTEYLDDLDEISRLLTTEGVRHESLRGADNKAERGEAVARFRDDDAVMVLIGSRVLEHGLNLQHARILVSVGQSHNPARERQREGRIVRIGSRHKTYQHWLFLPDTAETRRQTASLAQKELQAAPVLAASG